MCYGNIIIYDVDQLVTVFVASLNKFLQSGKTCATSIPMRDHKKMQ